MRSTLEHVTVCIVDSESIEAVRSVVTEVLNRAGDATDDWAALASAGLLALAVPEEYGGEGLGLDEVGVLLRETGARAVDLPVWETLCCGALPLAATGTEEQRRTWLPGVATGETLLTPALREVGVGITGRPGTTYTDGTVTGRKIGVTRADEAARLLVTARCRRRRRRGPARRPAGPGRAAAAVAVLERPAPSTRWSSTAPRPSRSVRAPRRS